MPTLRSGSLSRPLRCTHAPALRPLVHPYSRCGQNGCSQRKTITGRPQPLHVCGASTMVARRLAAPTVRPKTVLARKGFVLAWPSGGPGGGCAPCAAPPPLSFSTASASLRRVRWRQGPWPCLRAPLRSSTPGPAVAGPWRSGGAGNSDQQWIIATVSGNTNQHFRVKPSAGVVTVTCIPQPNRNGYTTMHRRVYNHPDQQW